MNSDDRYIRKIVAKRCYNFLEGDQVIVTKGDSITPFFLHGENAIGENANLYKKHQMNPQGMSNWIKQELKASQEFNKIMNIIKNKFDFSNIDMISGGRTRDWPFSGALAHLLNLPALYIYKPEDGTYPLVINPNNETYTPKSLEGINLFQIVDLVTSASSIANDGGWIDQSRDLKGTFEKVYALIDRNQGAKEILRDRGVQLYSGVTIDEEFLDEHDSKNKNTVLEYLKNPREYSIKTLYKDGIDCLMPYLNPNTEKAKKDNRLIKFVTINYDELKSTGLLEKIINCSDDFRAVKDDKRDVIGGERFEECLEKYRSNLIAS